MKKEVIIVLSFAVILMTACNDLDISQLNDDELQKIAKEVGKRLIEHLSEH